MTNPRGIYRAPGGSGDAVADTSNESVTAINAAAEAEASKVAAELSATNAASSASAASTSASNAATSATNAANSATSSATSATAAQTAETNAETAETNAETAQAAAEAAEDNAVASASLAQDWATKTSGPVAGSEYSAKYNAQQASTSASNASSSASAASSSASSASSSASTATTKASEAATSASNAATSASSAASSASTASTKASEASTSATNAASSASTASTQASNAASSASTAMTQAGIATTKAGEASTSASNAASSASSASTSASSAASAQSAAETARDQTLAAFDSFDDRYLGQKSTAPTVDNDGNTLVAGALYFNTTTNEMKVWDGSIWLNAYASLSGALLATNNLSDLNNTSIARQNLGVEIGVNVQAYDSDLAAFALKTAPTGDVIGSSDTQTLTNKTISADNNTLSGIAASSFVVSNASGNIDGAATQKAIPSGVVVGTTDSQTLTNKTISGASNSLSNIDNTSLTNSAITINGTSTSLGGSINVGTTTSVGGTGTVNGITLTGTVTSSGSLTLGGTLSGIGNSQLTNSSVTVNGTTIALGGSDTITAATPNALSAGTGLSFTTGTTFNGSVARTLDLANTAVTPGSYTTANITVDAQGRITAASSGTGGSGTVTSVSGTGSYGGLTLSGTVTTSGNITLGGTPTGTWPISITGASTSCSGNSATASRSPEWQCSGSTSNWDQQFRDTDASSATQTDLNSGTNCPTGGGWWFSESYRHGNSSSFWGTQYAHGWEDRANTRYQRNVSNGGFGQWYLDDGVRAWASFSSGGIRGSKNVSSWARQGTGQYTVNFAVAMPDTNYSSVASGGNSPDGSDIIANCVYVNSSQVKCRAHNSGAGQVDTNAFSIAIFR